MVIYFRADPSHQFTSVELNAVYGIFGHLKNPRKAEMKFEGLSEHEFELLNSIVREYGLPRLKVEKRSKV